MGPAYKSLSADELYLTSKYEKNTWTLYFVDVLEQFLNSDIFDKKGEFIRWLAGLIN